MMTTYLTWRQASARIVASVALGTAIAVGIASTHGSASAARSDPAPPGSAASQLDVLRTGPIDRNAPSGVAAGFDGASASTDAIRLLGRNAGGLDLSLYAAARANGGACNALVNGKDAVGTMCIETIPPEGITIGASDVDGWTLYGFAADDVVGVDVVIGGKAQPATLLENAYAADLGVGRPRRGRGARRAPRRRQHRHGSQQPASSRLLTGQRGRAPSRPPPALLRVGPDDLISLRWSGVPTLP